MLEYSHFSLKYKATFFKTDKKGFKLYGDGNFKSGLEKLGMISRKNILGKTEVNQWRNK